VDLDLFSEIPEDAKAEKLSKKLRYCNSVEDLRLEFKEYIIKLISPINY